MTWANGLPRVLAAIAKCMHRLSVAPPCRGGGANGEVVLQRAEQRISPLFPPPPAAFRGEELRRRTLGPAARPGSKRVANAHGPAAACLQAATAAARERRQHCIIAVNTHRNVSCASTDQGCSGRTGKVGWQLLMAIRELAGQQGQDSSRCCWVSWSALLVCVFCCVKPSV